MCFELIDDDKLHEECGVVGLFTENPQIASQLIYYGLLTEGFL